MLGIQCDLLTIIEGGDISGPQTVRSSPLPLGSYFLSQAFVDNHQQFIHEVFEELGTHTDIPQKQFIDLKRHLASRLESRLPDNGNHAVQQLLTDIERDPTLVHRALAGSLRAKLGVKVPPSELRTSVQKIGKQEFKIETNLGQDFGIAKDVEDQLVTDGLLAIGELNLRLQYMETYSALTTFVEETCPFSMRS